MEEISQDVMFHNIEGLALVARMVGTESVLGARDIQNRHHSTVSDRKRHLRGDSVDFALWASDFIYRYITCFQSDKPLRLLFRKIIGCCATP